MQDNASRLDSHNKPVRIRRNLQAAHSGQSNGFDNKTIPAVLPGAVAKLSLTVQSIWFALEQRMEVPLVVVEKLNFMCFVFDCVLA